MYAVSDLGFTINLAVFILLLCPELFDVFNVMEGSEHCYDGSLHFKVFF